jgi:poly-gamma-glutamate capsule biosynthesis protein CapA/YwtB (metallophosphatase superfamily)
MNRLRSLALMLAGCLGTPHASAQEFVVTFGGDVNFSRSREAPSATTIRKFGRHEVEALAANLAGDWAASDLNFINVETVVAEEDGHPRPGKAFVFRSHPASFQSLIDMGVNAFSLANNHAHDHGVPGMEATLGFFEAADDAARPLLYAGLGRGDAAFRPRLARINGITVALSAVSFGRGAFGPKDGRTGMAYYDVAAQYDAVLAALKSVPADLKILSIHYGTENETGLNAGQRAAFRRALDEAGVNLVLGHHPHVVRAVEVEPEQGRAIFYSLGNLLFIGGAGKDDQPVGEDYGLMGRAFFTRAGGRMVLTAIEAVPLKGVHLQPRPMPASRVERTLAHLNALSRRAAGDQAAVFTASGADADRGAMCFGGPYGTRARALCCSIRHEASCDYPDLM